MKVEPAILGVGLVDSIGIAGTAGTCRTWKELGVSAPGTGRTMHIAFGKFDPTFRRIDRCSRTLVLAAQAAGLDQLLSLAERHEAALIVETSLGCLEADLRYARALAAGTVEAPTFPYTLPSTCLGEVALRHGLRGPTICLSVEAAQTGASLQEAQRMIAAGEVTHAVVGLVEVLAEDLPQRAAALRAVVAVVGACCTSAPAVADWPSGSDDPFAALTRACR